MVHVDRQREEKVFGPTIDTVILGELTAEWLDEKGAGERLSALEIGSGSGLLSAILGSSDKITGLISVDLNAEAARCTLKNLEINGVTLDAKHQCVRVRAERFEARQFTVPFDLIVCNPPYIPDNPTSSSETMKEYGRAVGGLQLYREILDNLDTLLAPQGVLLLMVSSISAREVGEWIPEGFISSPALSENGRRVPLDVDTVWQDKSWRERLLVDQRIEQDADQELWHQLRPLWIKRREVD